MLSFSYKKTNIDFIGDIPMHWNIVKLKFLSDIINGFAFSSQDFSIDNKIPVIRIGDINTNVDLTKCVCIEKFDEYKDFLIKKGDILFAMTGATIGKNTIYKSSSPSLLNQRVCIFRSKINTDQDFLGNCIRSYFFKYQVDLNCVGGAQANIGREDLMNFYVPYPPLNEQKLISQYLDKKTQKIDSLIKKIETKIELLKEQKTALINQFVTKGLDQNVEKKDSGIDWIGEIPKHWEITKLKYESDLIVDGSHFTPNYVEDGVPFLRVTDLTYENISLDKVKFISYSEHSELSKRCHPKKGDLLLSKNGTIGKTRIVDWDWDFSIFVSLCLIRLKDEFSSNLLSLFFESNLFDTQIKEGSKQSTVTNLHLDKIREFVLIKPPIKEQNLIVRRVKESIDPIFNLIKLEEQKLSLLREYRQSLISSVITGKIRISEDMI